MSKEDNGTTGRAPALDPVLENVSLATACGADAAMILTAALTTAGPETLSEAYAFLEEKREAIEETVSRPGGLTMLAPLEPELQYEPELARVRPDVADHEVRGKLVFEELLGKWSFFKVVAWEIGGIELSDSDAELLAQCGVASQLADPGIWPLAATRRVAAAEGGLAHSLLTGLACMCTQRMAGLPSAGFMRFLDRVDEQLAAGLTLEAVVDQVIESRERVPGVGRPALGPDERIPPALAIFERHGRADGHSLRLIKQLDACLAARKGLRVNSSALFGALMRDLGFSPEATAAIGTLYFLVPVLAHSVFAEERSTKG